MPTSDCPEVLPQCLNTFLDESTCADNTDASCYCKEANFIRDVMECVTSWGADDDVIADALSYLTAPLLCTRLPTRLCSPFLPTQPSLSQQFPSQLVHRIHLLRLSLFPSTHPSLSQRILRHTPLLRSSLPSPRHPLMQFLAPLTKIISTVVTVPQVAFTSQPEEETSPETPVVNLMPVTTPAYAPVVTTTPAGFAPTTFGTVPVVPTGVETSPAQFTGAASNIKAGSFVGAAIIGAFALVL
ncbi:hypothetical protein M501DRAFT_482462 [Patellaria atrata CBS 101060]|uniref:CFEM domain-containing protein n=1 Tax=Patellaria atrata CBS 101060 TaxID=1346257 RepID=A0A9P4S295_9PEZI|nr:hypothetical protein M501DRAFT_482462 [Patellaria atrata CBS 101060]